MHGTHVEISLSARKEMLFARQHIEAVLRGTGNKRFILHEEYANVVSQRGLSSFNCETVFKDVEIRTFYTLSSKKYEHRNRRSRFELNILNIYIIFFLFRATRLSLNEAH